MARSRKFRDLLVEKLKDPQEAALYFNAILDECTRGSEEEAKKMIFQALKNITDAQGGI